MEWSRLLVHDIICSKRVTVYFEWGGNLSLVTLTFDRDKEPMSSAVADVGDRFATIDMGRKVEAAVPLSVGAQQLPTFRPMSTVHVYIGFSTEHSCTETWVDENQLVRVESNNFVRVVHLRLIHITGFFVPRGSSVFQLFPSRHEPKLGRWLCPFSRGSWVTI